MPKLLPKFTVRRKKKKKKKKTRKKRKKTGRMSFQLEPSESLISYLIRNTVEALVSGPLWDEIKGSVIDLFTDTAAILNLFDLRGIMGCLGGALAQCLRALLGQKENFTVYFSGKRRSLLHPNTTQRSFFPITIFLYENFKKNWPEKRA